MLAQIFLEIVIANVAFSIVFSKKITTFWIDIDDEFIQSFVFIYVPTTIYTIKK